MYKKKYLVWFLILATSFVWSAASVADTASPPQIQACYVGPDHKSVCQKQDVSQVKSINLDPVKVPENPK